MTIDILSPFVEFGFMRRALTGSFALALSSGPVGVLLLLRRMSLMGDAMSHAILPGAALGFVAAGGISLEAMGLGGVIAGLGVALLSGVVTRSTRLNEDASFACFYLTSLALGVMLVSLRGSNIDLLHVLFGTILAIDPASLRMIGGITTVTLLVLALIWRPLVAECVDPAFLRAVGGGGSAVHLTFLLLVVLNLVASFQALGTLMAVGMMMLPAATARLWAQTLVGTMALAAVLGVVSGFLGLVIAFRESVAAGPAIILTASALYALSLLLAPRRRSARA